MQELRIVFKLLFTVFTDSSSAVCKAFVSAVARADEINIGIKNVITDIRIISPNIVSYEHIKKNKNVPTVFL